MEFEKRCDCIATASGMRTVHIPYPDGSSDIALVYVACDKCNAPYCVDGEDRPDYGAEIRFSLEDVGSGLKGAVVQW